jgi:hypothetical protein
MIDPTYLRTIYDGLHSGTMHKDNAATLPIGLIGIYEEALPPSSNVNERKMILEFFGIWALVKKEVSAAFVASLLEGWTEALVLEYIGKYSKWFNSPVSGKYVLYHERLRSFSIQKISQRHFDKCNASIIQNCQTALQFKSGDEWERYALEHLSTHLLIQAMKSGDVTALKALAYNTVHWNRQVEISKGFEWSKCMLNDMMLWASKYDDDEVIECALNKVDLHHQEQNDAPRIVELVAQNDIETALQRIESFGGNDKEGLQRKFILYMLCLMELTLLNSKDKPFRKEAIEQLLKHLDDNLPVDHSVLNWNDFFPSYLMFQMAFEWARMDLDYTIVFKGTFVWEMEWIYEKGPFSDKQFEVLLGCVRDVTDDYWQCSAIKDISINLAKQGKIAEALECAQDISYDWEKSNALNIISVELAHKLKFIEALECAHGIIDDCEKSTSLKVISSELARHGNSVEAESAMKEALECARTISYERAKCQTLAEISTELVLQGNSKAATSVIKEVLEFVECISDDSEKSSALEAISTELAKQGKWEESIECSNIINIDWKKSSALVNILTEMRIQGRIDDDSTIQAALECARSIEDEVRKNNALLDISRELTKREDFTGAEKIIQEAITLANNILNLSNLSLILKDISAELFLQDQLSEAIDCAVGIRYESEKSSALIEISTELAKQGKIEESLECANHITAESFKKTALKNISNELIKQGNIEEAISMFKIALNSMSGISDSDKNRTLEIISNELLKKGIIEEAIEFAHHINNELEEYYFLERKSIWLAEQGKIEEALKFANIQEYDNSRSLYFISIALARQGKITEAASLLSEALESEVDEYYELEVNNAILEISTGLTRHMKIEVPFEFANKLSIGHRIIAFMAISSELKLQGKHDESSSLMQEALACARGITNESAMSWELKRITTELTKQGNIEEALECAKGIPVESVKSSALKEISKDLAKLGQVEAAIECAQKIIDLSDKRSALIDISSEMTKQGKIDEVFEFARSMSDESYKSSSLESISLELAKQGMLEKVFECIKEISDVDIKNNSLKNISKELSAQGKSTKALDCAQEISDEGDKSSALAAISYELAKQGKLEEANECASRISVERLKYDSLKDIIIELAKQDNWLIAERIVLEITNITEQHNCLKELTENTYKQIGMLSALERSRLIQNTEVKIHYLKGLANSLNSIVSTKELILKARSYYNDDIESMEKLLQNHALNELFFRDASSEKIGRLNRSLNIQWAIDIKNQLPN